MPVDALRARLGRRLEAGSEGSPLTRILASGWAAWSGRFVGRPLRIPDGVCLIGVGGAVLGGAGKTPVTIALARALASRGYRPAVVGHAYRARPGEPRRVYPSSPVSLVGDDALAAARLLAGTAGTAVVVAPHRQAAIDHAAALGHRLILADGLLQTAPTRLAAAILVVDAGAPWGAGACPPLGDLRAPRSALLTATDVIAALQPPGTRPHPDLPPSALSVPSRIAGAVSASGEAFALQSLASLRVGLLLTVARPDRIAAALAGAGIHPLVTLQLGDHAIPSPSLLARASRLGRANRLDAWLTTARCATKLPDLLSRDQPVLALDHRLEVTGLLDGVLARVAGLCPIPGGPC